MTVSRVVRIEGTDVAVLVERVTVAQLREIGAVGYPRGADISDPDDTYLRRCQISDTYVRPDAGAIVLDGTSAFPPLAATFAGQRQVVADLYDALVSAQLLSPTDRQDLDVSARFAFWLADASQRGSSSPWVETGTSCGKCHALKLCARRGCDGTPQRKAVWHDGTVAVKVCPVRSFSPDIEATLRLFFWTHQYSATGWVRGCLPSDGGIEAQDAWTMAALGVLQVIHNRLMDEARGSDNG